MTLLLLQKFKMERSITRVHCLQLFFFSPKVSFEGVSSEAKKQTFKLHVVLVLFVPSQACETPLNLRFCVLLIYKGVGW